MRNFSIEQLSIRSNSHAVVSKGGVVMLFIREAEGKVELNGANKTTDCKKKKKLK